MPNQEWVNSSKYSSETLPPSVELPWTNKVKLDKMFATDNLEKTKLRKMVRAGIPDSSRGEMYARILRVDKLADYEKHYELALIRTHGKVIPAEPLAPSFGGRTHRHDLALNSKGVVVMDHILCILAHDFPNLEFCPFVPACVALLAHHMRDADELLGAAVSIIKKSMAKVPSSSTSQLGASDPKSMDWAFFPTYRKGVKYLFRAYGNLLHRTNRKVHQVLVEGHKDSPDPIWARWLTSMLIDVLPLPALWRMLDCFVLEGYRALLRFGIGVVIANKDALMKASDMASINAIINSENPLFIAVAPICKAAEGINATRADTVKLQDHHNTLAKLSHSDDIHQPQYRFQRGMPKIVGAAMESESVSSILSDEHWIALWSWIPPSKRVEGLELLFTTKEHGTHVNNMFRRTEERAPLILLVESTEGAVFGAYLSHQFPAPGERTDEWYGNGETFLFSLAPYAKLYPWIGRMADMKEDESPDGDISESSTKPPDSNARSAAYIRDRASMFTMISKKALYIGGGGDATGLYLNETLTQGDTGPCQTFENVPLTGTKERHFECHVVEVFAFS